MKREDKIPQREAERRCRKKASVAKGAVGTGKGMVEVTQRIHAVLK